MMPWIAKAEKDLKLARVACADGDFREHVGFLCQQAAEKYMKALLTHVQVEFRKTHKLVDLLKLVASAMQPLPISEEDAEWLTPFGVDARYPSDTPEMLPGEEHRALDIAERVKRAVLDRLALP